MRPNNKVILVSVAAKYEHNLKQFCDILHKRICYPNIFRPAAYPLSYTLYD